MGARFAGWHLTRRTQGFPKILSRRKCRSGSDADITSPDRKRLINVTQLNRLSQAARGPIKGLTRITDGRNHSPQLSPAVSREARKKLPVTIPNETQKVSPPPTI